VIFLGLTSGFTLAQPQKPSRLEATRSAYAAWEQQAAHAAGDTVGICLLNDLTIMYMMHGWADSVMLVSQKAVLLGERIVEEEKGKTREMVLRGKWGTAMDLRCSMLIGNGDPVGGVALARKSLLNAELLHKAKAAGDLSLMQSALRHLAHGFHVIGYDSVALGWSYRYLQGLDRSSSEEIAMAYIQHAAIQQGTGRTDSALYLLRTALRINDPERSPVNHLDICYGLAKIHLQQGASDSARHYAIIGRVVLATVPEEMTFQMWGLLEGQLALLDGRPLDALRRFQLADSLGALTDDPVITGGSDRLMAVTYGVLGNVPEALAHSYRALHRVRRELGVDKVQKLAMAQAEMVKEKEIALQALEIREKRRSRDLARMGTGVAIVLAGLLAGWVVQGRRNTARLRSINAALLQTQAQLVVSENERATEAVRTRIARDIHDELGSELTRLSLISDRLRGGAGQDDGRAPMLKDLADGARRVTHLMSDVVWAVDPVADTAQDLLDRITDTAMRLVDGGAVKLKLDLQAESPEQRLGPEQKRDLHLVAKEALNNAIKYASASTIEVMLHLRHDGFSFRVSDDGVGLQEQGRSGHGLGNMRARMARFGAELSIGSIDGGGTMVEAEGEFAAVPA